MKQYVRLTVDVEAYYSGNTYFEEVFLPLDVWNEIKEDFRDYIYLHEFDGKHSEVKAEIYVDKVSEKYLSIYTSPSNDGDNLFEHVYEYLDVDKYGRDYLGNVQEEVKSLCQVETMTIKFEKRFKDSILEALDGFIIKDGE